MTPSEHLQSTKRMVRAQSCRWFAPVLLTLALAAMSVSRVAAQTVAPYGDLLVASAAYYTESVDRGPLAGRLYKLQNGNWEPLSRALKSYPTTLGSHGGSLYCGGRLRLLGENRESIGIARWDGQTTEIVIEDIRAESWTTSLEPIGLARAGHPTRIAFRAGSTGEARLEIFDARGRKVRAVARLQVTPGRHVVEWDLVDDHRSAVARGLYFVRLQLEDQRDVRKVVIAGR